MAPGVGPGSIPNRFRMWVKFVVGSRLAVKFVCCFFFSGAPVFLPPEKKNFPNSNSFKIKDPHENQLGLMWLSFFANVSIIRYTDKKCLLFPLKKAARKKGENYSYVSIIKKITIFLLAQLVMVAGLSGDQFGL